MMRLCSIDGCDKIHEARGYCKSHYKKFLKHGSPLITRRRVEPNNCGKNRCPALGKMYYAENSETIKKQTKDWYLNNKEAYKQTKKKYLDRDGVRDKKRESVRRWCAANSERIRQMGVEWRAANSDRCRSNEARKRARKKQAMPSWLTPDHISQINAIYAEARSLEAKTGVPHHVDHIVPLEGKIVCGLHVPWNLRAIPAAKNLKRPRIYKNGMD